MPRSFKKQAADGQALMEEAEDVSKCTFGVPLEDCFPSPNNEVSRFAKVGVCDYVLCAPACMEDLCPSPNSKAGVCVYMCGCV